MEIDSLERLARWERKKAADDPAAPAPMIATLIIEAWVDDDWDEIGDWKLNWLKCWSWGYDESEAWEIKMREMKTYLQRYLNRLIDFKNISTWVSWLSLINLSWPLLGSCLVNWFPHQHKGSPTVTPSLFILDISLQPINISHSLQGLGESLYTYSMLLTPPTLWPWSDSKLQSDHSNSQPCWSPVTHPTLLTNHHPSRLSSSLKPHSRCLDQVGQFNLRSSSLSHIHSLLTLTIMNHFKLTHRTSYRRPSHKDNKENQGS